MLCERDFNAKVEGIDACRSTQFAQADMGRNISLFLNFMHVKGPFYINEFLPSFANFTLWKPPPPIPLCDILLGTMHYGDSMDLFCKSMTYNKSKCHQQALLTLNFKA